MTERQLAFGEVEPARDYATDPVLPPEGPLVAPDKMAPAVPIPPADLERLRNLREGAANEGTADRSHTLIDGRRWQWHRPGRTSGFGFRHSPGTSSVSPAAAYPFLVPASGRRMGR